MSEKVVELFGYSTQRQKSVDWQRLVLEQICPYLSKKCIKIRKSKPEISIGTCSVCYGRNQQLIIICPFRLLQKRQVFLDALHLLSLHKPGNELHIVSEVSIPGGSVDYFLVSARRNKPVDFVGIELQTLDTTGTVWPARQQFLNKVGVQVEQDVLESDKKFGMNWKMTAKTILIQLLHKVDTFEHLSKHIVLAIQDCFIKYLRREFSFDHLNIARSEDSAHLHIYSLESKNGEYNILLEERYSTDAAGISASLGLQVESKIDLDLILEDIQQKMSAQTRWDLG